MEKSDVIFAALPHGLSQELAAACDAKGKVFIDLGADFRLENEEDYEEWYGNSFAHPELHKKAVYGLPELFRERDPRQKADRKPRLLHHGACRWRSTPALASRAD